jgi:hypothetical protein
VAHGEDEAGADEHAHLTELHLFDGVEVAGRAQHHEQGVAVTFDLRALVGLHGVLHRQRVQVELLGQRGELVFLGLVQPDPRQPGRASWPTA